MSYVTEDKFAVILIRPGQPRERVVCWDSMRDAVNSANRLNTFANESRVMRSYIVEEIVSFPIDKIVACP
jgi:hypothetical protein